MGKISKDNLGRYLGFGKDFKDEPRLGDYRTCDDMSNQIYDGKNWRVVNKEIISSPRGIIQEPTMQLNFDDIYAEVMKRLSVVPTYEHKCHNCGGTLKIKKDQGIFKCPYCRSAYAIGTKQINARY